MKRLKSMIETRNDSFSFRKEDFSHKLNNKEYVDVEFKNLTADKLEESVDCAIEAMRRDSRVVGFKIFESNVAVEQMKMVLREVAKDGCSTIVLNRKSNRVLAVCFNKIRQPKSHHHNNELTKFIRRNVTCLQCLYFLHYVDSVMRQSTADWRFRDPIIFPKYYTVEYLCQIYYIGTRDCAEQRGLAVELCKFTLKFFIDLDDDKAAKVPIGHYPMPFATVKPAALYGVFANARSKYFAEVLRTVTFPMTYYEEIKCNVGIELNSLGKIKLSTVPNVCVYYL